MSKKVLLFLAQGFEPYEASVFTDVFGWSRECGSHPVEVKTVGFSSSIKSYWNLIVQPEMLFHEIRVHDFDALAIPGGYEGAGFFTEAFDESFLQLIRDFNAANKPIASVCVAALAIGKSGVLKGRKATIWDLNEGNRRKQLAELGADVQDASMVIDKNIITSTGPATGIPVALALYEMLTCKEALEEVKFNMRFTEETLNLI